MKTAEEILSSIRYRSPGSVINPALTELRFLFSHLNENGKPVHSPIVAEIVHKQIPDRDGNMIDNPDFETAEFEVKILNGTPYLFGRKELPLSAFMPKEETHHT